MPSRLSQLSRGASQLTRGAGLCAAILISVAGCATTPIPNEKIAVAKSSVQRAEQAGAPEFAPVEMARQIGACRKGRGRS